MFIATVYKRSLGSFDKRFINIFSKHIKMSVTMVLKMIFRGSRMLFIRCACIMQIHGRFSFAVTYT